MSLAIIPDLFIFFTTVVADVSGTVPVIVSGIIAAVIAKSSPAEATVGATNGAVC